MHKSVRSRALSAGLAVALCVAMVFGGVLPAFADINILPANSITTSTNPYVLSEYETSWREGWGNSGVARFFINVPQASSDQTAIVGAVYAITRPESGISSVGLGSGYNAPLVGAQQWVFPIDIVGEVAHPGPYFNPAIVQPGTSLPVEGRYRVPFRFFTKDGLAVGDWIDLGLDMTPPRKVTGLQAWAGYDGAPGDVVVDQSRVHFTWDDITYDDLSGVGRFEAVIDGEQTAYVVYDGQEHYPGLGRFVGTPREMTIEEFPSGTHTVQIRARDRAENPGPLSDPVTVTLDNASPTAAIVTPDGLGAVASPAVYFAAAVDDAGLDEVRVRLDGLLVQTVSASAETTLQPISGVLPVSLLASGAHTLTVEVDDAVGHTGTVSRQFTIDSSIPARLLDAVTSQAYGWSGTSTTNPYKRDDDSAFWRESWGSSLYPQFTISEPALQGHQAVALYYTVDRTPWGTMSPATLDLYYRAGRPGGTDFSGKIDQAGLLAAEPQFAASNWYGTKATVQYEGIWFWHMLFETGSGSYIGPFTIPYGIDRTNPARVAGLGAFATPSSTTPISGMLPSSRVHLKWNNAQQDKMSGTAYYRVYVDGVCALPGPDADVLDPVAGGAGVPWYRSGVTTASATIEDLSPGLHVLQVSAVDRAGNEGAKSAGVQVLADTAPPSITLLTPATAGGVVGAFSTLSAKLADDVGLDKVVFKVDGMTVGSQAFSANPQTATSLVSVNLSSLASGSHTLDAEVTDVAGKTASVTRSFILDKVPPTISSVTGAPSPFYPRKRDGYKDNFVVKFKSSEAAKATLTIKDSSGKVWRTISKPVPAGASSIAWNGKSNSGAMKSGTFKWYIQLADAGGNKSATKSGSVSLKYYEIIYVGGGARVIER